MDTDDLLNKSVDGIKVDSEASMEIEQESKPQRFMDFPNEYAFRSCPFCIGEIHSIWLRFADDEGKVRQEYPWADRFVCGFPIPEFQRDLKWSAAQKARLIQSIWFNIDIGSYIVTGGASVNGVMSQYSDMVIDGQQRLSAIEDYFADRLAIPDTQGTLRLFSEISPTDQRFFRSRIFSRITVASHDLEYLKNLYNIMAFGGVAHEESERDG